MILITGGTGQLGTELRYLLDEKGIDYVATGSKELDITNKTAVFSFINELKPTVIYHCAAYTAVDQAETRGKASAEKINIEGTRNVAEAAKAVGAILVYISTDYVFDGEQKDKLYQVDDETNPLNEYGRTKLAGEKLVQEILDDYYIIRTSWVFGQYGKNFVSTVQNLAETQKRITVVNDQFGRPTWTRTLAEFMLFIIENQSPFGVYHLSNENSCSWYEFAKELLKETDIEILPIASKDYQREAKCPQYAIMDLSKTKALGFELPTWQEAVESFK